MKIFYFAWIRERIGRASEELSPPQTVATASELAAWLCEQGENYRDALGMREGIKVAVNQTYVPWDHPIKMGDEVAFFPPVTGG